MKVEGFCFFTDFKFRYMLTCCVSNENPLRIHRCDIIRERSLCPRNLQFQSISPPTTQQSLLTPGLLSSHTREAERDCSFEMAESEKGIH